MSALNIRQEPKLVIFQRFNALNHLQLNPDDFIMGPVEEFTNPQLLTNARVQVSPLAQSNSYNSFYIYYSRMDLATVCDRINIKVLSNGLNSLVEILDFVNLEFGIYATVDDLEDTSIVYDDVNDLTGRATVLLEAKDTSYLYTGSFSLLLNERINPYDPGIKNAITGVAWVTDGTADNVVNLNTSLSDESYFNFLEGVSVNTPITITGLKMLDNEVYVFGDFDLDAPVDVPGSQGSVVYHGVTINRIGQVLSVDRVARFDNVYQKDVCFKAKPDGSKYYLADERKHVTGNISGLYRYNKAGERDNTLLTNAMAATVDQVLPLPTGFITVSTRQAARNNTIEIKKFNESGAVDATMLPIEIKDALGIELEAQAMVHSYGADGSVDGFYVLLRNFFSQPITPLVNGAKVYGNLHRNKNNYILPVLKFTLEGILDTTFNGNLNNAHKDFFKPEIGEFHFEKMFSVKDGIVIFNRARNPITGVITLVNLKVNKNGSIEFLNGADYFDMPIVKSVSAIVKNNNTFLASVVVEQLDQNSVVVEIPKVIGYDSLGKYTGTFLELSLPVQINDMVVFKN